ncbi:MAG: aminotransferase [Rhodobacteraceae bacterium PARR1]|nr:MAG: aminotransferase [Rhodobacteraceae bacterium PARR1]
MSGVRVPHHPPLPPFLCRSFALKLRGEGYTMTQTPADAPLGALLTVAPPVLSPAEAARHLSRHWGMIGALEALTSERDLNFRLTTDRGRFVVKIANSAEPVEQTRFQNRALRHIAERDPALPVPRVVATRAGADDVALPSGHLMRVISWLDGTPLHAAPRSPAQARALAVGLAHLGLALQGFNDPAASHVLQWDIRHAAHLRRLIPHVTDEGLRALCAAVLDRFDAIAAQFPDWRWQVVHNDLNPHNVLVGDDPDTLAGIIDFGDMVRTPLICDLAVACSYQVASQAGGDPLARFVTFAAAYHGVLPLTEPERAALFDLTAARMVTTVAIASWRAARHPENAPYILRNFPSAQAGLTAFAMLDRATVAQALHDALPMEAS